ncbi:MAG: FxLYD domain-containing protein, partial [Methanobacterium sp.]
YKNDIQVGAATYDVGPDGTATGGCAVRNTGSSSYKQVEVALEIYDANGNLVGNETKTVGMLAPGETINYFEVTRKVFVSGVSARAVVVNATKV